MSSLSLEFVVILLKIIDRYLAEALKLPHAKYTQKPKLPLLFYYLMIEVVIKHSTTSNYGIISD
ncbi:MAG: hypothetical protein WBA93_09160 [Microcoleaceae cyanobacterium]